MTPAGALAPDIAAGLVTSGPVKSRWVRWPVYVVGTLAGVALFVLGAWLVDTRVAQGDTVMRNVELEGYSLGGLGDTELHHQVGRLAADVAAMPATVATPEVGFAATSADVGLALDEAAVAAAAWEIGREGSLVEQFETWGRSFFTVRTIEPAYVVDDTTTAAWVEGHPDRIHELPIEPWFTGEDGNLAVTPGVNGRLLTAPVVTEAITAAAAAGDVPVAVEVAWSPLPPMVDEAELALAVDEATRLAARPLTVRVGDQVARLGSETIRRWIDSEFVDGTLVPVLAVDRAQASLERVLLGVETEGTPPTFTIVDDEVEVASGRAPMMCCGPRAGQVAVDAVATDYRGAVALPLVKVFEEDAYAEQLGVTGMVAEFTTDHACCENRVRNIQRMADIVRGVLIEPGETFSLNDYVGERTRDNGFVPAGTILSGRLVDTVGGGVSQFATTTFNAAFFAGLDFVEYKSHSIYISRYPYGREATINFPDVDLVIENNTPYAVLIWTAYTDTSITVQMWSTPHYAVEQTGQAVGSVGACTRVTTFRERIAPNGAVTEDSVFAVYRPGEGLDCNGNPTPRVNG
jgi:vancomycin resistance protein YoaR